MFVTHGTFLWLPGAEWHAALNDFPPALIVASLVFDLWGRARKKETLLWAGYWCLNAGAAMAILAVVSGLMVEGGVEQTRSVHQIIEMHETLGIALTILFSALPVWRFWGKNQFRQTGNAPYTR